MTKICTISDLHGNLNFDIEPCDLLLMAGDICGHKYNPFSKKDRVFQKEWMEYTFSQWLDSTPAKHKIYIYGNHDFVGVERDNLPKINAIELFNSSIKIEGIKIWGGPYSPFFYNWAFNAPDGDEDEVFLNSIYEKIPEDTDIILSHGPPKNLGDLTLEGIHTGSKSLLKHAERVKAKWIITGHIHEAAGEYNHKGIKIVNASVLDRNYQLVNKLIYFYI